LGWKRKKCRNGGFARKKGTARQTKKKGVTKLRGNAKGQIKPDSGGKRENLLVSRGSPEKGQLERKEDTQWGKKKAYPLKKGEE